MNFISKLNIFIHRFGLFLHNKTITSSRSFKDWEKWVSYFSSRIILVKDFKRNKTVFSWDAIFDKIYKNRYNSKSLNFHHSNNIHIRLQLFCNSHMCICIGWAYNLWYVDEFSLVGLALISSTTKIMRIRKKINIKCSNGVDSWSFGSIAQ